MMGTDKLKVIIACGGTGGHVFPGIAIAQMMTRLKPGVVIVFAGTERGIEKTIIPQMGWQLLSIGASSIKDRKGVWRFLAYMKLPFSIGGAVKILRREKPDVLIGVGGYAAGPLTLAAAFLKIPNAIVEPNAIAGMANRMLGRFTKRIYIGFKEAEAFFSPGKVMLTGNPVREEIIKLRRNAAVHNDMLTIFCFGGSQGALAINRAVMQALPFLKNINRDIRFIHQIGGKEDIEAIKRSYEKYNFRAQVFKFTDRIWEFYSQADLIIARAGATTVAEISVVGIPAIFIPYPFAADDHQMANAQALVRGGGAVMIAQKELTGERLAGEIKKLTPDRLAVMQAELIGMGRPNAAQKIVEDCLRLVGKN